MKIDRQTLLQQRSDARSMVRNQALSEQTRNLAKMSRDKADAALGLMDALDRKARADAGLPDQPTPSTAPPTVG